MPLATEHWGRTTAGTEVSREVEIRNRGSCTMLACCDATIPAARARAEGLHGYRRPTEQSNSCSLYILERAKRMFEFLSKLFDTSDYPARWNCGNWNSGEGWLHICSDIATWAAYMAIPLVLFYYARRRTDFPFSRLVYLFAAFILACGAVHLVEAIIFWYPLYRVSGVLKLITAIVSWGTVVALVRVTPYALELPSVKTTNEKLLQEIEERRKAETKLGRRERLFRRTFENAAVGMAHVSTDGKWLQVNDRLCQILGYTREELLRKTFQDVSHPDDLQADLDKLRQSLDGSIDTYSIEKRYIHFAGHDVWANVTVSLVRDADDQPDYFVSIVEDISERIHAQQQLERTNATFMSLIENAPFGVYAVDEELKIQRMSKGAAKAFASVQPLIGRALADVMQQLWPAAFVAEIVSRFQVTLETGETFTSADTTEKRTDSGQFESYHWQLERITLPSGQLGVVCYFYDTTELRHVEHALRQSQQNQDLLLSFQQAGRETQDEKRFLSEAAEAIGRHLNANRVGFVEVLDDEFMSFGACWSDGVLQPLEGKVPIEAIGSAYAAEVRAGRTIGIADTQVDPLTADADSSRFGTRARIGAPIMRDGQWQAALYISQATVRHWTPQEIQFVRTAADQIWEVVEKNRSVKALEVSESRLRLATKLAGVGVLHCDYSSETIMLDETAAKLYDLTAGVPLPRDEVHARFHPEDNTWITPILSDIMEPTSDGAMLVEHRVIHQDGSVHWLDVSKQVFFSQSDLGTLEPAISIIAAIDITDQKNHEASLEEARYIAESANRARGEFLANMSHEIRTPMTAIMGYADLLSGHINAPDAVELIETIRRNGRFLIEIINDILDISKIDAGKLAVAPEVIAPEVVVADAISLMNVRAQEKQLQLEAQFEGRIPKRIVSDGKRLRQILLNLIGNAIKFTNEGAVQLKVRYLQADGKLEFSITDSGIGIRREDLANLFQPFVQVDASHTRSFGGTGLGLAISRRLTELLGGEIQATSEVGRGSTFTFTIDPGQVDEAELVELSHIQSPPEADDTASVQLNGNFLVVDDRRDIRFLAQSFIEQAGGSVATASNGQEGVDAVVQAKAAGQLYTAVLMDMQMPVMDGYSATAEIRRLGFNLPIIALTANAMDGDAEKCMQVGCDSFLTKPIDRNALLAMLQRFSN